jgi:hypothetical protein
LQWLFGRPLDVETVNNDVDPASEPAAGGLARVFSQSLFGNALSLRDETEKVDCDNTILLGFNVTDFTTNPAAYRYST